MFSKRDILNIAYRNWKGDTLKAIAADYDTTEKAISQLRKDNRAEFAHLETEFRNAEIQRLTAGDATRKTHYGIVLSAYMLIRSRAQLPQAVIEFSQQSHKPDAHIQTLAEAETLIAAFESDFGITLI